MVTISEDFVSFETAKLLKEKGFDQNCATYYLDGQVWRHYHGEVIPKGKQIYAAPIQAMAMKWLREVHNLYIQLEITTWPRKGYFVKIYLYKSRHNNFEEVPFVEHKESYEEACEAACIYALKTLI